MILVFGETGQVATELRKTNRVASLNRQEADLSTPKACSDMVLKLKPKAVINAAAFTDVDTSEANERLATVINGEAPTAIATACAKLNIPIVHISTDYVFSGFGIKPWSPSDVAHPLNAYGRSKLSGEIGVLHSGAAHAIVRTSWIISPYGKNFLKTMLRLAESSDVIRVVSDQIGGPTSAYDIASACLQIAEQLQLDNSKSGIYHFCGGPYVSWADFASEIFLQTGQSTKILKILTSEYSTIAKRPLNSRLDCSLTEQIFGIPTPNWKSSLYKLLVELEDNKW